MKDNEKSNTRNKRGLAAVKVKICDNATVEILELVDFISLADIDDPEVLLEYVGGRPFMEKKANGSVEIYGARTLDADTITIWSGMIMTKKTFDKRIALMKECGKRLGNIRKAQLKGSKCVIDVVTI